MQKLERKFVEKVWGVDRLPPVFGAPQDVRIGEVWYDPPAELQSLLVKALFASERLSVQAHPSDDQAQAMGLGRSGKSECWVITAAEDGATIAVGFRERVSPEAMRSAALDGSIVDLLEWHPVERGDAFYIPAGTVHAIGGGVSLIEVQQNTDITFRLYDYGRPRELHLDDAMQVAITEPYPSHYRSRLGEDTQLVDSEHFRLASVATNETGAIAEWIGKALLIPFEGRASVDGVELAIGECSFVDDIATVEIGGDGLLLVAQPQG
ncbi:class I mannose-6-phosphate isomerase [Qipengyuania soli]|uniref:Class I mannose-6-phosphate isomerase n=1 Tax=Qipengyuania soli TaxID=2782568 RepID=A0A7S8F735_9SPHN|nr:class I mannose-6-phosphate isomerase [Qipengyuania soli]QPD00298.1 class I mannose-6-phosphate isomerase [Qipengyuania soli]